MSLVIAMRLANGDVLFSADKRETDINNANESLGIAATSLKLREAMGGIVGFVGDPNLAKDMALALPSAKTTAFPGVEDEIQSKLLLGYHRRAVLMNPPMRDGREVSFLFASRNIPTFFEFRNSQQFSPIPFFGNWHAVGFVNHAGMLRNLFRRDSYSLLEAQRLSGLQILAASRADPTYVSEEIDMWLLTQDEAQPVKLETGAIVDWSKSFLETTVAKFYAPEAASSDSAPLPEKGGTDPTPFPVEKTGAA